MLNKYPYTDFNEYNMDWIIKTVKDLTVQWAETHQEWEDTKTEWENYKTYIDNYFTNLDDQNEINNKINAMIADGTFSALIEPFFQSAIAQVPGIVSDWIANNLLQETGYVIDKTLTVANAAADSEAAGLRITDTDKAYAGIIRSTNLMDNSAWISGSYIQASSGVITAASGYSYQFVRMPGPGYYQSYRMAAFGTERYKISIHDADMNYIKTLTAANFGSDAGFVQWQLTEQDFAEGARYAGISRNSTYEFPVSYTDVAMTSVFPNGAWWGDMAPHWYTERALKSVRLFYKRLVATGDSLMNGAQDLPDNKTGWYGRLLERATMSGYEDAQNGAVITYGLTFADLSPRPCIARSVDTLYANRPNADYVLLEGGTNDADVIGSIIGGTIPAGFGTWSETDYSGTYDDTTFCGAFDEMCYKAVTQFKGAKIAYIIPPQMGRTTSVQANRRAYFDEAVKICKKWHIPVLDLWNNSHLDTRLSVYYDPNISGPDNVTAGSAYYDGQHLTSVGYDMTYDMLEEFMNTL